jgi:hypothetical protein
MSSIAPPEDTTLANKRGPVGTSEEQAAKIERLNQRLDMLDDRLDNIDSMVTVVAERVMSQLVTLYITCPHCGKSVEIAVVGSQKPGR